MSLTTEDLYRAQPFLGHPATGNGAPVPWKLLEKPPLPDVPGSHAATRYPPVQASRPRDLSLRTWDIDGTKPRGTGGNCESKQRVDRPVDPINPHYKLVGCFADEPPLVRASGRNSLDVSDIEGATARPMIPFRSQYGETLKVEDDFRNRRHLAALAEVRARAFGLAAPRAAEDFPTPRAALTPRKEGPQRSNRSVDPQTPRYRVPLASDTPGTSLCCTWAEEQRYLGVSVAVESGEIGPIHGSAPNAKPRDGGEPFLSLETRDVAGAQSQRRIGAMPYSIYGPYGQRRDWNSSLDTRDLPGAQADTLARYPKVSCQNSARGLQDEAQMSARGRLLKSCPEKV